MFLEWLLAWLNRGAQAERLDADKTLGFVPKGLVNAFTSIQGLFTVKYGPAKGTVPSRGNADQN
jgi:hypothetical protein